MPPPPGLDRCRSLLEYEGAGRELVARLKYRNARSVVAWLATGMAGLAEEWVAAGARLTWAPTSPARRRQRGFDQAQILARAVAAELGTRAMPTLVRGDGPPQTGRLAGDRLRGVSFTALRPVSGTVIVVDDVLTSGGTMTAAADGLRAAGATSILGLTAGRTPLKVVKRCADA